MKDLSLAGMDCARINLSHASYESCLEIIDVIRGVRYATNKHVAIMYDTKGPEFRTLDFESDAHLIKGQTKATNYIRIVEI